MGSPSSSETSSPRKYECMHNINTLQTKILPKHSKNNQNSVYILCDVLKLRSHYLSPGSIKFTYFINQRRLIAFVSGLNLVSCPRILT